MRVSARLIIERSVLMIDLNLDKNTQTRIFAHVLQGQEIQQAQVQVEDLLQF